MWCTSHCRCRGAVPKLMARRAGLAASAPTLGPGFSTLVVIPTSADFKAASEPVSRGLRILQDGVVTVTLPAYQAPSEEDRL
jgi:hypothetical protein